MERIFESMRSSSLSSLPNLTGEGMGMGLGLSLSYNIITKGHGGKLKVATKESEGMEFTIQLPINYQ